MLPCRLIVDPPASGAWNMAVDEALLESVADGGPATLRFYQWSEPTLSLGYFQPYADREQHEASRKLTVVRRSTGGGALVHDHELTYSLALPATNPHTRDATALTCLVHKSLIAALEELVPGERKLTTHTAGIDQGEIAAGKQDEPFLCFQRRSPGDLLAVQGLYKVCGSAQRRRQGALLQHGGVLLARSREAPELPGLANLAESEGLSTAQLTETHLAVKWSRNLKERLGLEFETGQISNSERALAERLAQKRFSCRSWIERR